jgi:hypothetical protein
MRANSGKNRPVLSRKEVGSQTAWAWLEGKSRPVVYPVTNEAEVFAVLR